MAANNVFRFIMLAECKGFEVRHTSSWHTWKHKSASLQSGMNNTGTLLRVVGGASPHERNSDTTVISNTPFMAENHVK
jgi:hypothetical protein